MTEGEKARPLATATGAQGTEKPKPSDPTGLARRS
jgi:hypothetical protein